MATYLGNRLISGAARADGTTINYNNGRLQGIATVNKNTNNPNPLKFWTGTRQEYLAIENKDPNTLYNVTDDASDKIGSGFRRIGEIVTSTLPLTDAWLHLLDGALIQGNGSYGAFVDYIADLYNSGDYTAIFETEANWQSAVATYGVCGKFVYDSVNNTVRLPKITGIIEGTTDLTALGDLVEAGLPNITGSFYYTPQGQFYSDPTGAFYNNGGTSASSWNTTGNGSTKFDASRSSSIYGNSTTVQPQSIKVLYYIVVATSTKTDIEVDIDEIATDLNNKQDTLISGTNIKTINNINISGSGNIDITGGGGGPTTWGNIGGTLANQTDLQTALNSKSQVVFRDWS